MRGAEREEKPLKRILIMTCLMLLAVEIGPPVYRASVEEGLAVVEAHDKPKPDPPKPDPKPVEVRADAEVTSGYWWVVRILRPTVPVYGPYLSPVPECLGHVARFPTLYRCVRLPLGR